MSAAKPLGIKNLRLTSQPLGGNHQLSTVFLPEHFSKISTESTVAMPNDLQRGPLTSLTEHTPADNSERDSGYLFHNHLEKSSDRILPTVVDSLSQIRPLNEATMETLMAIAPDIVFDRPGSNASLVPVTNTGVGNWSSEQKMPNAWSNLAELVENSIEDLEGIDEDEIVFTPTGFQRQPREHREHSRGSTAQSSPLDDTYSPSVAQPMTISSPYMSSEPEEPENLDAIVNEVYRRIVDRLQIERERNGRFYSGRLPW